MKIFNQKKLAISLTALGVLPFVCLAILSVSGINPAVLGAPVNSVIHGYGVVIASFLAGMHWGIHFSKRTADSIYLISSFVALMMWGSLRAIGTDTGLWMVMIGFILLWVIEYRLSQQRVTTAWFWFLRNIASAVTCASLLAVILFT